MQDYARLERLLVEQLGLERRPIAISFRDMPPPGLAAFTGTEPAGCGFWRLAAGGQTFYTVPKDHYNCPIGSYTHNLPLPPERAPELDRSLALMASVGYLRMEDVPGVARLTDTPGVVVYSPLAKTPVEPDVILFAGRPGRLMLLQETALRAGVPVTQPPLARPTCMAIPAALASGLVASGGCIGNRIYTEVSDDELYMAVPGKDLARLAAEIETVASANAALAEYHRGRLEMLRSE